MTENTLDRKDLKILAYKEKVAELLEQVADLRVEMTVLNSQLQEAAQRVAEEGTTPPDASPEED